MKIQYEGLLWGILSVISGIGEMVTEYYLVPLTILFVMMTLMCHNEYLYSQTKEETKQ